MIDYTNDKTVQYLKQYEMLANSLTLITEPEQRENVCFQLNKLNNNIIDSTNEIFEKEFNKIKEKTATDLDEEKTRLTLLIDLIENREKYLEDRKNKHRIYTGLVIETSSFCGQDLIAGYKNRIEIINKYSENIYLIKKYTDEIAALEEKLSLAQEKINISNSLNNELEVKLKQLFENTFSNLNLFELRDDKENIEKIYKELEYILSIAEENIKITHTLSYNVDLEEQNQYEEIEEEYIKYKEKKCILELFDIYDKKTKNYDELMEKRKCINDIINQIPNSELYIAMIGEIKEQFITLKGEQEDINTYRSLEAEKENKESLVAHIKDENNSEIFQDIIKELVKKEEEEREKKLLEQKREEEEKKQRIIQEEEERQEEIKKRQKLIEEMRKKDMEERAKQLLEEKQKSVLQHKDVESAIENNKSEQLFPNIEKVEENKESSSNDDKIFESPIFQEIKEEIKTNAIQPENEDYSIESSDYQENSFNEDSTNINNQEKIINPLPDDLDEYMKNFDDKDADIFKEDQIFVDY